MISFKTDNARFNYRIVGVAIKDNKILLHKSEDESFWALPGGRGEMFELSTDTIVREMEEELSETVKIDRLLWILENFFEHEDRKNHELSLFYLIKFNDNSKIYKVDEFDGIEQDKTLKFKWFDLNDIEKMDIRPKFLKKDLKNIPNNIEHIINKDIAI